MAVRTVTIDIHGIERLMRLLSQAPPTGTVKAGILEGTTSTAALSGSNKPVDVLDYAPRQEFGGGGIPPRPFLRTTYARNKDKWTNQLCKAIVRGSSSHRALELVGGEMEADIIDTIKSNLPPPNSNAWVKYKEKNAPAVAYNTLQFTGTLIHSIAHRVYE